MKIRMPKLTLPKFTLPKRKKVRATVRRSAVAARAMDYEEMSEPNMKLSRALLIVLVLHVVAVAGIIAFNSIKTHQKPRVAYTAPNAEAKKAPSAAPKTEPVAAEQGVSRTETAKPAGSPARAASKEEKKVLAARPAEPVAVPAGDAYVVVKGDNPVTIAKKFNVSYDELLALNHITDPHKLQIGQKLRIPEKTLKKKSEP